MDVRLIIDEPARGSWNMAVDEALLRRAGQGGEAAFRFYRWNEPTLSLGYFQPIEDRGQHSASAKLPVVRRATGGGAIVHHHELTYSFVTPLRNRFSNEAQDCVRRFHQSLIDVLAELGVNASLAGNRALNKATEPFLCFHRRNELDVLIGHSKIVGSAQRRHHGAMLQHGSILLTRSRFANTLSGIEDLTSVSIDADSLIERWAQRLAREFDFELSKSRLLNTECANAKKIEQDRFAHAKWTNKR